MMVEKKYRPNFAGAVKKKITARNRSPLFNKR
jgi:hypothetical protein